MSIAASDAQDRYGADVTAQLLPDTDHPAPVVVRPPRWLEAVGQVIDGAVMLIGGVLIILVLANVALHVMARDIAWVTELGELMMVWVTFLGGAAASRRNAHMTINEIVDKLSPEKRRWADAAIQLFCLVILGFLFIFGWKIVAGSWGSVLTTLNWPMAWQYMPLPLSAIVMAAFLLWDLLLILRNVPREQRYLEE